MRKPLALAALVAMALTACGSSDAASATATEGDAFCKIAQSAKDDHDALDALDPTKPESVKLTFSAAVDSLSAVVAKAPKDIVDTAKLLLSKEEELEKLLKDNDYDVVKMAATPEGQKLSDDKEAKQAGDDFDKYLSDKCGIATSDTTPSDTTPSDTTPSDSTPSDTTPSDDSSVDTIVDLGEGADAINQFLDYYELGTGAKLTSDERSCIVDYLADKITGSDLNQAIAGQPSAELQQALGLAFLTCKVTVGTTP